MTPREEVFQRKLVLACVERRLTQEEVDELSALNKRISYDANGNLHVDGTRWTSKVCECGCWSAVDRLAELA